jgi:dephospho-CoA kinase
MAVPDAEPIPCQYQLFLSFTAGLKDGRTLIMTHDKKDVRIFPLSDHVREKYEVIKAGNKVLLNGLTGGIASGKSTVAQCLKELGSAVIDFDILARQVVMPGEKAWGEIVEYFGQDILLDNREIDRKKISGIVFLDAKKRKILEGFTHPAIGEEFVKEVTRLSYSGKNTIIQVVVPLLIECSMQELFHAITLIYIPREKQVIRLAERDGITRDNAMNIISAQMPIDEKIRYADFVINNCGSIEETRVQTQGLWDKLLEMQKSAVIRMCKVN